MANIVVADSISQCLDRGEISHAIKTNVIIKDKIIELDQYSLVLILEELKKNKSLFLILQVSPFRI